MPKRNQALIAEEEQNVLTALQRNAKETIMKIAKECQMSKEKCSRIIRHLEKTRKIWGYTAIVDDGDLPYKKFILLLKRTMKKFDDAALDEFPKQIKQLYEPLGIRLESSYYINGEYDLMVIFTSPDLARAKKFSKLLFEHYPGMTENVNLMEILYTHRAHYILNPNQDPSIQREIF